MKVEGKKKVNFSDSIENMPKLESLMCNLTLKKY